MVILPKQEMASIPATVMDLSNLLSQKDRIDLTKTHDRKSWVTKVYLNVQNALEEGLYEMSPAEKMDYYKTQEGLRGGIIRDPAVDELVDLAKKIVNNYI